MHIHFNIKHSVDVIINTILINNNKVLTKVIDKSITNVTYPHVSCSLIAVQYHCVQYNSPVCWSSCVCICLYMLQKN